MWFTLNYYYWQLLVIFKVGTWSDMLACLKITNFQVKKPKKTVHHILAIKTLTISLVRLSQRA